ncbi:HAD-IC family P-type ATPase [Actinoplanes sp. NPDC051494]|uniref:HAD-IC family P-type ATPase n=1 Tax=Actinoplanes sp. NPDC051494 TaxID=3363907 RepID=UPI0037A3ED4A
MAQRTYGRILRTNVFSFFNTVLFVIGAALLALGRYSDALISVGLGLINAVLSAVQEIRAKRKFDRLQLLERSPVSVLREGRETLLDVEQVVAGDVLLIRPGDQIVVDGPLQEDGAVEADESLLTGESEPVVKKPGDDLRSGSFCVAGQGRQLARDVGADSYAGRLTAQARQDTTDTTPLQRRIEFVVRLVITLTVLMSGAIMGQAVIEGVTLLRTVQIAAVLSGLIPYGLFLLIAVAYTGGAAALARHGALVQRVNAVESVSNVDVVCTDKTGTLTTGELSVDQVRSYGGHDAGTLLGGFARSVTTANLTTTALAASLPGTAWTVRNEVPFTSAKRWSGLTTPDGTWMLGAPDVLAPDLPCDELTARGLRVLVLTRTGAPGAEPELAGLVALADRLRPEVTDSISRFHAEGVAVKVLSGDDPRTVAALAVRAGLGDGEPVAGPALDDLDDAALDALVARTTVFGRVAPEQKERIVRSLRRQGRYVAMIGDGVNDARALKSAQVGVAMRSGSAVTRDVADIVLLDDSFAALLPAQREGRHIVNGIATSMYVFLARVASQGLVILAVTMLGLGFPYSPAQVGLTLLTVGVPTFFLTRWAPSTPPDPRPLIGLARFVIPAALVTAGFGTAVYAVLYQSVTTFLTTGDSPADVVTAFEEYTGLARTDTDFVAASAAIGAQTGLSTFFCLASFVLILFLAPPVRLFAAWTPPTTDRRPTVLVAVLLVAFAAVLFVPALSTYFGLTGPGPAVFNAVLPALALWFAALSAAFRFRLLDRVLGLPVR